MTINLLFHALPWIVGVALAIGVMAMLASLKSGRPR
jgi:hypothetical protein